VNYNLLFLIPIALLVFGSFNIAFAVDNNCGVSVWTMFQLPPILGCIEDRLDALENQTVLDSTTASNLGSGHGIFASEVGNDLQFKSLVAGGNVTITSNATTITINSTASGGGGESNTASNVGGGSGWFKQKTGVDLEFRSVIAGSGINITDTTDDYTISANKIGQDIAEVSFSNTKTNIGTTYVDIYTATRHEEDYSFFDCGNMTEFIIVFDWDYVGTGNQQVRWVDLNNNANVLFETAIFTTDQFNAVTGWFDTPAWCTSTYFIEMQGKSSVGTDDPIIHGYKVMAR